MTHATEADLRRARDLLAKFPLIDGHNDLPWVIRNDPTAKGDVAAFNLGRVHPEYDTDIPRLREGQVSGQIWAAFVPSNSPHPSRDTLEQIDVIRSINELHADTFRPVLEPADIQAARAEGKIASIMAVEGGVGLENSLKPLRIWHALGVRLMTLCHNGTLDWIDSATDEARHHGLTEFGRAVVRELNRLGIIVDCAHVSPDVMHQVLDISTAPIVFSHSNVRAMCDHVRNVPDDVLDRVRQKNGLVMATFVGEFLSEDLRQWMKPVHEATKGDFGGKLVAETARQEQLRGHRPRATLDHVANVIERLAERIGPERVGIGSDFFGMAMSVPDGLENVSRFPYLLAELLHRGWSEDATAGVAGLNFIRTYEAIHQAAEK